MASNRNRLRDNGLAKTRWGERPNNTSSQFWKMELKEKEGLSLFLVLLRITAAPTQHNHSLLNAPSCQSCLSPSPSVFHSSHFLFLSHSWLCRVASVLCSVVSSLFSPNMNYSLPSPLASHDKTNRIKKKRGERWKNSKSDWLAVNHETHLKSTSWRRVARERMVDHWEWVSCFNFPSTPCLLSPFS